MTEMAHKATDPAQSRSYSEQVERLKHKQETKMELTREIFWQTQDRGTNRAEYEIYLACADDGNGIDITTGRPLKTFEEWLNS